MSEERRSVVPRGRVAALSAALAFVVWVPAVTVPAAASIAAPRARMVRVPAGSYLPLYAAPAPAEDIKNASMATQASTRRPASSPERVAVAAFDMDVYPVTNGDYLEFVRAHPEWRRSKVAALFADASYLRHWRGDLELGDAAPATSPVVYVSWFAARGYLRSVGKVLPTVDQWEYVAAASETRRDASRDPGFLERLRIWYGRPTPARLPPIGSTSKNAYGVHDLHGLVWEWTLDFNSALVTGESRADSAIERMLYCGNGAAGASNFENYPAFMRFAFRSSLEARYAVGSLGFRGVTAREAHTR